MTDLAPKLRAEGRYCVIAAAVLVLAHAGVTMAWSNVQQTTPTPPWVTTASMVFSSLLTVLMFAAPMLLVIGVVLIRLAAVLEATLNAASAPEEPEEFFDGDDQTAWAPEDR